jgi:TPR repeat protein
MLYAYGRGVPRDVVVAARHYTLAAAQGCARACCALGRSYALGEGVPQDYAEAARLWRRSAEHGDAEAQFNLACLCAQGMGVPQDHVEAARLCGLAAVQGDPDAQCFLGHRYAEGVGVPQDLAEAARLWRLAAAQGVINAGQALRMLAGRRAYVAACCSGCGATRKLKTCTRCKVAGFCGAECQRREWAEHKPHCTRWAAAAPAAAAEEA